MKRLMLLLPTLFIAACTTPRAAASPLATMPPTAPAPLSVSPDSVATLEMLSAAVTFEAARTATAEQATRQAEQWQATREVGNVTATAVERAAQATATAQTINATGTAMPIAQTQVALALTHVGATQNAVRATLEYSTALSAATATQVAQVGRMEDETAARARTKMLLDGLVQAMVYGGFGLIVLLLFVVWKMRDAPRKYVEARIARLRLANVSGRDPIWLPDSPKDRPQSLPIGGPSAEIVNNDGTRTAIPITDPDMQPEAPPPADLKSERPVEQQVALQFLDVCYQFAKAHPGFPADMVPDYRALKEWAIKSGHAVPQFATGAKWQYARDRFGEALVGIPGTGTRVAKQWRTVSGLYNAVLHGQVQLV